MRHPETELIALLRGDLVGPARDRVDRHLASCAACRAMRDDFRAALAALERGAPEPPALHPSRYRAQLRAKLDARRERSAPRAWWRWPFPLALSAGLAGMLVFLAVHRGVPPAERGSALPAEEAAIARRLDLLRNYQLVERLDLLEDFDILRSLDSPAPRES